MAVEPSTADNGESIEMGYVIARILLVCKDGQQLGGDEAYAAKRPVKRFPTRPPTAWTAKMSKASSIPRKNLTLVA